jgi:UDP-N-acetylglucosamine 2-epimerase (non-hydrolysing)
VTHGTNRVVGTHPESIVEGACDALSRQETISATIPGWDGHAAERIIALLHHNQLL